jgi:hypothetical protein
MICVVLLTGCAAPVAAFSGTGSRQTVVTVRIDAGEESVLYDSDVTIVDNTPTAYMALKAATDAKSLSLEINAQEIPDIMFLNGIDGITSEDPKFWVLHVNGSKAEFGMGIETVKNGDVVEFIYQNRNI